MHIKERIFISISVLTTFCLPIVGEHAEGSVCAPKGLQEDEPTALLQTSASLSVRARAGSGSTFAAERLPDFEQREVRRAWDLPELTSKDAGIERAEARMKALSAELSELSRTQYAMNQEDQRLLKVEVALTTTSKIEPYIAVDPFSANVTRFINYTQVNEERAEHSVKYLGIAQKFQLSNWRYFVAALVISFVGTLTLVCCFSCLRKNYVLLYSYHSWEEQTPYPASTKMFGWISNSVKLQTQEVMRFAGLDAAMFLRFTTMCLKAFASIAILIILVYLPLHCLFGIAGDDTQYLLSIDDLQPDLFWIWWVHSGVMLLVIIIASYFILDEMRAFLPFRFLWLQTMPYPRCQTVLVENLPLGLRTESRLKDFFNTVLGKNAVQQCSIVRNAGFLAKHWEETQYWKSYITDAEQRARRSGKRPMISVNGDSLDEIAYYERKAGDAKLKCDQERRYLKTQEGFQGEHPILSSSAFVTFVSAKDTEIARLMVYAPTTDIVLSVPPDPSDVVYTDLVMNERQRTIFSVLGVILMVVVFAIYSLIIMGIACLGDATVVEKMSREFDWIRDWPFLEDIWDGTFQPLMMTLVLLFLPMLLGLVLPLFFPQKSQAFAQYLLQRVYYPMLFFFAVVFNCLGFSMLESVRDVFSTPQRVHNWIVQQWIDSSTFYVKFLALQWITMSVGLLRLVPMAKFCWYRRKYHPALTRELSEPEDPSLYGIGSRSAYLAFLATVTLIFCQISPLVGVLGFHTFAFNRVIYGYLLVFTETRKPDLGGMYFVQQLRQLFLGLHVFAILMAGYITYNSNQVGPTVLAWVGFLLLLYLYFVDFMRIQWETLPAEDMDLMGRASRPSTRTTYLQPELEATSKLFQYDARDTGGLVKTEKETKGVFADCCAFEGDEGSGETSAFQDFVSSWSGPGIRYGQR